MANRFGNRILFILITSIVIIGFLTFLFFYIKNQFTASRTEITETGMVQKITSMGKLELVKYTMKDVIEQKEIHPILPDSKVLFLAVGQVTACIDLTKVKKKLTLSSQTVQLRFFCRSQRSVMRLLIIKNQRYMT